jgi:hypothetical protein
MEHHMVSVEITATMFRVEYIILFQKVEAADSFETVVIMYQNIRRHVTQHVSEAESCKLSCMSAS